MKNDDVKLKIIFIFAIFFGVLFFAKASSAATYYVSTSGNDVNNGLSSATPWKTIAKVNTSTFIPGDQILFKRGEIWREQLNVPSSGSEGNVITFGAYGSEENPIISGSNLITAGWSNDSANIWRSTVTTQPTIVYVNGTRGTLVASKANITSEFKWYWASNVLYVWSPSNSDPSAYYTSPGIEAGTRNTVVDTNEKIYITVDGLTIRDANSTAASAVEFGYNTVTGLVIKNCTIERSTGTAILIGGVTANGFTVDNCTIQNNGGHGIRVDGDFSSGTISNNIITGNGWGSVRDNSQYSGIQGHLGNLNIFKNTIYDNTHIGNVNNQSHGIYHAGGTTANIYQNTIYNHENGDGIVTKRSANIYRNEIYGNRGHGIEVGWNEAVNVVYVIYSNVIYSNNHDDVAGRGIVEQAKGSGTLSLTIYNNTIYQNGRTTGEEIAIGDNVTLLAIKNNLLWASDTRRTLGVMTTQTGIVDIDYNLHWRADGAPNIRWGTTYPTWAQWQAMGYDLHGVNGDPLLVSASTSDFTLQSTSPCINAGANVGLIKDFAGISVPQGSSPDIGAYEYVGAAPTDTTPPASPSGVSVQ